MTLLKQQAKQEWLTLLVWSLALGGLIFYTVVLYQTMGESLEQLEEAVKALPEALRGLYGGNVSLTSFPGYLQVYGFGSWIQIPYLIYTALFVASISTREIDRRTMEFLLSLPVERWQVILSRWLGLSVSLLVLQLVHLLAIWAGVVVIGEQADPGWYLVNQVNAWLLYLAIGSVMLALSMFVDDYGRGVGVNLGIGLGLFAFQVGTETAIGALKTVREWMPLSLYDPAAIIGRGEVPWGNMAALATVALAGLLLSILLFQRKQITV